VSNELCVLTDRGAEHYPNRAHQEQQLYVAAESIDYSRTEGRIRCRPITLSREQPSLIELGVPNCATHEDNDEETTAVVQLPGSGQRIRTKSPGCPLLPIRRSTTADDDPFANGADPRIGQNNGNRGGSWRPNGRAVPEWPGRKSA
jgi:hypothetical protein